MPNSGYFPAYYLSFHFSVVSHSMEIREYLKLQISYNSYLKHNSKYGGKSWGRHGKGRKSNCISNVLEIVFFFG